MGYKPSPLGPGCKAHREKHFAFDARYAHIPIAKPIIFNKIIIAQSSTLHKPKK